MKRNRELKNDALKALDGHWGWVILACLIEAACIALFTAPSSILSGLSSGLSSAGILSGAAIAVSMLSILASFWSGIGGIFGLHPLNVGTENAIKNFVKEGDIHTVPGMFRLGFADGRYWRNVASMLLVSIFTCLWAFLFIIPGIIKAYAYSMTPYILIDNPELGPNEARHQSIEMMRGHKWKMFGLDLSFIGWILLCFLSLGIGFIWLTPYRRSTKAAFYLNLKEEYDAKNTPADTAATGAFEGDKYVK